jgi:hypothetical protein
MLKLVWCSTTVLIAVTYSLLQCLEAVRQGQLFALAAAHPEAYTALIDSCVRSAGLRPNDLLAAAQVIAPAVAALMDSQALLSNTAAVAGLASCLTSLVKRAVQSIRAAASMRGQPVAISARDGAAAYFPAVAHLLVQALCIYPVSGCTVLAATSSSSSSSYSQMHVSAALLGVVLARSLVQLADAIEAAGPQLLHDSLVAAPSFEICWAPMHSLMVAKRLSPLMDGEQVKDMPEHLRLAWQQPVVKAAQCIWDVITQLGLAAADDSGRDSSPATAAATAGGGAADQASNGEASSSTSAAGGSTSSSGQQVQWSYLLNLQQLNPVWAAAAAKYRASLQGLAHQLCRAKIDGILQETVHADLTAQLYADAVDVCRALVAAAPLPVTCNNPSCENLAGASEAAAASKVCSGCRCRYCSAACQTADWRRHKRACRRMAAAGQSCQL